MSNPQSLIIYRQENNEFTFAYIENQKWYDDNLKDIPKNLGLSVIIYRLAKLGYKIAFESKHNAEHIYVFYP